MDSTDNYEADKQTSEHVNEEKKEENTLNLLDRNTDNLSEKFPSIKPTLENYSKKVKARMIKLKQDETLCQYAKSVLEAYETSKKKIAYTRLSQIHDELNRTKMGINVTNCGTIIWRDQDFFQRTLQLNKDLNEQCDKYNSLLDSKVVEEKTCAQNDDISLIDKLSIFGEEETLKSTRALVSQEEQIEEESCKLDTHICSVIHRQGLRKMFAISSYNNLQPEGILNISPNYLNCIYFMKKLKGVHLPPLEMINFDMKLPRLKILQDFIATSLPGICNKIRFYSGQLSSWGPLLPSIIRVSHKASQSLALSNGKINEPQLKRLLRANKDKTELYITKCCYDLGHSPDFTSCLKGTSIQKITFSNSEGQAYNNWVDYPERLEHLLGGLLESDLKHSLGEISFGFTYLKSNSVKAILEKHGLPDIELTGRFQGDNDLDSICSVASSDEDSSS
ncbi:unnamed protein product [Moneuplotes crassus]|uniref:Uncharacterized protein n=1 Tax=Euplotes crassus TaxID=5936 RepID=A0AAD1UKE4_EUPCR|nr:unnamed protein product [Moneuplotes crassus]